MQKTASSLIALAFLVVSASRAVAQESEIKGLPPEAPRVGTVVTVDVSTNTAYLFRDGELIKSSKAATGSDKILRKGTKVWWFRTPRGRHVVQRKVVDPVWTKPDWAFVEKGQKIPPADSPLRKERGTMGKYALDLGDLRQQSRARASEGEREGDQFARSGEVGAGGNGSAFRGSIQFSCSAIQRFSWEALSCFE
jgi:hypothetical protein